MRSIRTCLAVSVVAGCAIARGDALTAVHSIPERRDLHQKQIAEKSESERARLQHNFREFRGLPADEQARLRFLNIELTEDDRVQGRLRDILNQYHEWLGTLTVGQREDLRQQADPNKREKRIRELLKEQQEHAASTGSANGARAQRGLNSDDLAAVLGVFEGALRARQMLSEEEKAQLLTKVGLSRHMYIMGLAYRRPGVPPGQQFWFPPQLVEAMAEKLSNPKQINFLKSKEKPGERRWVMINLILGGLMSEYEKNKPTNPDTLEQFFVQLSSDKQDEIMRLPYGRQQQKLTHMYLEKKSEEEPDKYPRPPRPGFWMMQSPAGFRPQGRPGGEPQRGAEGDQSQRENGRKKNNKNATKKDKAASDPDGSSGKPEG